MTGYFARYPTIRYNGRASTDIARRVVLTSKTHNDPRKMYPLRVTEGLRPDTIANAYYGSPDFTWLVYMANDILDPYYDWALTQSNIETLAITKFGSVEEAQRLVKFYRLNWSATSEDQVTTTFYAENMDENLRKYYEPVFGDNFTIVSYRKRREDWIAATNRVIGMETTDSNTSFTAAERIEVKSGNTVIGRAQVSLAANSTYIYVQHVSGNTSQTNAVVVGITSGANVNLVESTTLNENITPAQEVFWTPVTEWDYLEELNQNKGTVRLVDARFKDEIARELENKLA